MKKVLLIERHGENKPYEVTSHIDYPSCNDIWLWDCYKYYFHHIDIEFFETGLDILRKERIDELLEFDYILFIAEKLCLQVIAQNSLLTNLDIVYDKIHKAGKKFILFLGGDFEEYQQLLWMKTTSFNSSEVERQYSLQFPKKFDGVMTYSPYGFVAKQIENALCKPAIGLLPGTTREALDSQLAHFKHCAKHPPHTPPLDSSFQIEDVSNQWVMSRYVDKALEVVFSYLMVDDPKNCIAFLKSDTDMDPKRRTESIEIADSLNIPMMEFKTHTAWANMVPESLGAINICSFNSLGRITIACLMGNKPCIASGAYNSYFFPDLTFPFTVAVADKVQALVRKYQFEGHIDKANKILNNMVPEGSIRLKAFLDRI